MSASLTSYCVVLTPNPQRDEIAELAAEHSLLKKLKRGEISEAEFDKATGLESSSDEEEDEEMREVDGSLDDEGAQRVRSSKGATKVGQGMSGAEKKAAAKAKKAQRKAKHKGKGKAQL